MVMPAKLRRTGEIRQNEQFPPMLLESGAIGEPVHQPVEWPAIDDSIGRDAGQACVGHGDLRVPQLRRRMRIAVEREETPRVERIARELVVDVLTPRVAVDLDRDV